MKKELKKILYTEDEEDIRAIVQIALVDLGGFIVKFCHSGQQALEEAKNFSPDLLLLDLMMPGVDGFNLLKKLRQIDSLKEVPAIFITAKVQVNNSSLYKNLGVLGVINKPFNPMLLTDDIKKLWDKQNE